MPSLPARPATGIAAPPRGVATHPGEFSHGVPGARPSPSREIHHSHTASPRTALSLPYRGTAQHLGGRGLRWDAQALLRMAPCQRLVFQAQGRFLPERLSQLKTEANFGPSPSGRARRSLCLRQRRPPVGAAGARPAPEGCGWPEETSCSSGQRDGSRARPGHRTTGT